MNSDLLLAHFNRISDAPGAISRLRQFILDLAFRGMLADQDPTDQPTTELIARIRHERSQLIRSKKIKATRLEYGRIAVGEEGALPRGWSRSTISETCDLQTGATPDRTKSEYFGGTVRWLRSGDVNQSEIFECEGRITEHGLASSNCKVLPANCVLMALNGQGKTRATVAILRIPAACNQSLVAIIPINPQFLTPEYLFWNLRSRYRAIRALTGDEDRRGLNMKLIACFEVSIPPVAEQKRIVSRINELMALCDRLEAVQRERESRRDQLAASAHHHLNNGGDADALRCHAQFFIGHLPGLTARPDQVKQLRQTILNLAVRGKLVPQDPSEEPASALFGRIKAEKARLIRAGMIRAEKYMPEVDSHDLFKLPSGWIWTRWNSISLKIGDIDHKMPETVADGVPFISPRDFLPRNGIDFEGAKRVSREDFLRLSAKIKASPGDLIYPRYGTIGENRLVTAERDFLVSYSCAVIKVMHGFVDPHFQYIFSISSSCKEQAKDAENKTTQANVGIKSIQDFGVPLPPLAEQCRIVAKVNELMAMCDQLETRLTTAQTEANRLLESVLHNALHASANAMPIQPAAELQSLPHD